MARRNAAYRKELYQRLAAYFVAHPCLDCGQTDVRCLQFDHRDRTTKLGEISIMVRSGLQRRRIQAEIDKCDVRCANCHSKRTAAQFNTWRHQLHVATQQSRTSCDETYPRRGWSPLQPMSSGDLHGLHR